MVTYMVLIVTMVTCWFCYDDVAIVAIVIVAMVIWNFLLEARVYSHDLNINVTKSQTFL